MPGYREICMRHHGRECWVCGASPMDNDPTYIEAHHIRGRTKGDGPENLIPLCRPCHAKVHTRRRTYAGDLGKLQWIYRFRLKPDAGAFDIEYDGEEIEIVLT